MEGVCVHLYAWHTVHFQSRADRTTRHLLQMRWLHPQHTDPQSQNCPKPRWHLAHDLWPYGREKLLVPWRQISCSSDLNLLNNQNNTNKSYTPRKLMVYFQLNECHISTWFSLLQWFLELYLVWEPPEHVPSPEPEITPDLWCRSDDRTSSRLQVQKIQVCYEELLNNWCYCVTGRLNDYKSSGG